MKPIELWSGDCLDLMRDIPARSTRLVLTDLPYGTTANQWDSAIPLDKLWDQWLRILKPDGVVALTCTQPFTTTVIGSNMEDFRYCWSWDKVAVTGFQIAKKQPLRHLEDVAIFYREFPVYNPQGLIRLDARKRNGSQTRAMLNGRISGQEQDTYVQEWTNWPKQQIRFPRETGEHETQKPVALMAYLVKTYSNKGDLVVDCCMGSGTTAMACVHTQRDFIGIELRPDTFATAERRVREARSPWDRHRPNPMARRVQSTRRP